MKVRMYHTERMVIAKYDIYKRVYADDKAYTYPRLRENRLRVKDQLYFENTENTGSKEGPAYHRDILFPRLKEIARELDEGGEKGVGIVSYY